VTHFVDGSESPSQNLHAYHTRLTLLGRRSTSSGTRNVDDELHGRLEKALTALGVVDVRETK